MMFEASNIIPPSSTRGHVSADQAVQAHADLVALAVEQWPYELLASRVWKLRNNLSSYDASYVALAEITGAPLVTLDRHIAQAPGLRCAVATA
jgi:predicted nucleic acid-binding protein